MLVIGVYFLVLLAYQCVCAPQVPGDHSVIDPAGASPLLTPVNPFGSGEENRRLMQSYIKAKLKAGQEGPDTSWEQEVFYLFSLHDYDRSSTMDGLELMKLLSEFNSHKTPKGSAEPVVAMVDFLLQTQDLNGDGLIAPSELLSPPKLQQPNYNSHDAPNQGVVVAQEHVDVKEEVNPEERKHEGDRQEVMTDQHSTQEEQKQEEEGPHAGAPAAVHQGQSEM